MGIKLEDLISQKEAAEIRGVSIQAIDHLIRAGRFRTVKLGDRRFLFRKEVEEYSPRKPGPQPKSKTAGKASRTQKKATHRGERKRG